MASSDLPPIMLDHLYSMDDNLKAEGPLLLLEDARENPVVGDEPSPETTPVIEPGSISRCCIEKGLFPAVPLFFQYPCSISKGWSKWVDRERRDPSTCNILRRAQVLDAIFLSKLWDIHIEAKMLRHVARRWSAATHTFVFLWEHLKGLDVHSLPHSHAMKLANWGRGSYMPKSLPLVCRWFKRMQRKGQDFLKLLDNVENFVFPPYGTSAETFTFVPFYADVSDIVEVPAAMSQSGQFRKYAMLNFAPIPLPTLGDSRSEISVPYSSHRVRRQFGLDQGVPSSPNHADPFVIHRVFWSNDPIPNCCRPLVLASKRRIGGFSRGYQAYWNHCLASFREFQSFRGDRLPPTTARLAGLVSEEKAIPLSQKRNLPFISKRGDIVGEFPKTKPRPGVQSPCGSGKSATPVSGKRKREEEHKVREKQTASKPKRFIPKVAPSGPPRTK
ncbi:unnamed protein product [Prunus armeniaca]